MSKDPHIANMFAADEEDCLSLEQLTAYQEGKLPVTERHAVERHLLDCELCAVTYEALGEFGGEALAAGAAEVSDRAWDHVAAQQQRKRRGAIFWIASAAAIALLVTVGYWTMRGPTETQLIDSYTDAIHNTPPLPTPDTEGEDAIAMTRPEATAEMEQPVGGTQRDITNATPNADGKPGMHTAPAPVKTFESGKATAATGMTYGGKDAVKGGSAPYSQPTAAKDFSNASRYDAVKAPAQPAPKASPAIAANERAADQYEQDDAMMEDVEIIAERPRADMAVHTTSIADRSVTVQNAPADKPKAGRKEKDEAERQKTKNLASGDAGGRWVDQESKKSPNAAPVPSAPAPMKEEAASNAYDEGMIAYREANYTTAASELRRATELTPTNLQAHLYAGDAFLRISQPQAALYHFERVLAVPGNSHYEDAEWYKALALLQLKEGRKAKAQLEKVVARNGKYKAEAQAALDKLD